MTYTLTNRITRLEGVMRMGECPRCRNHHVGIRYLDPATEREWLADDQYAVPTLHNCEHCGRAPDQWIEIVMEPLHGEGLQQ